ncbi:hypothetical protein BX666DRAFT_1443656 [Dichotomocladium elegans]|nr:hypothetical protein BX666DRAFT_1443656 [Dichotomocladium elegans]
MTESKAVSPITTTTLADGTTIYVNDHVYLAPEHLGECYYIGRVMEFCSHTKRRGLQARIAWYNRPKDVIPYRFHDSRLLVATMHSDLNPVSSIRGKCVVVHKHYILPSQLVQFKRKDDHFYYYQLYDRYMQRLYDIVPCELVQNVPTDIQEALCERYQFVVVEQGKAADLMVARRTCDICHTWCASPSSVRCAACMKNYHMACLNPPLLRKPAKGFAWQCAFCSRKTEIVETSVVEENKSQRNYPGRAARRQTRNLTRAQAAKNELPRSDGGVVDGADEVAPSVPPKKQQSANSKIRPQANGTEKDRYHQKLRVTNMWPFRYFGIHTDLHDILDIDGRIYPRARGRLGARYQTEPIGDYRGSPGKIQHTNKASTPPRAITTPSRSKAKQLEKRGKTKNKRCLEGSPGASSGPSVHEDDTVDEGPVERGTDATITRLFAHPTRLDEFKLDQYMEQAKAIPTLPLPAYSSDIQDRILLELESHNYNTVAALEAVARLTADDFPDAAVKWTGQEEEAFEKAITVHGHDLYSVSRKIPTKRHQDVVRYFYRWKKTDRYEPVYSQWTVIYKPTKRFKRRSRNNSLTARDNMSPDEDDGPGTESGEEIDLTVVRPDIHSIQVCHCANCLVPNSPVWRRMPTDVDRKRKHFQQVLCNLCGEFWLKYGVMRKVDDKANGLSKGTSSMIDLSTPNKPMFADGQQLASTATMSGKNSEVKRKKALDLVSVKKRKVGLRPEHTRCAVCANLEPTDLLMTCFECHMSVHGDCYGAAKSNNDNWLCDICSDKKNPTASYHHICILCKNPDPNGCQALKKTSCFNWAHVLCAMYIPNVKFVDTEALQQVEYIGTIDRWRWEAVNSEIRYNISWH